MKRPHVTTGVKTLLLALACAATTAHAASDADLPSALNVPAGQKLSLEANASGVQIYECKANKDDPKRFEWTFKAPEAQLTDANGKNIGKHYAGPTWEAVDGSKVIGEVKVKDPGPDPASIPWLLLSAKSAGGGAVLGRTQSIQRLHTSGGNAPAGGCTPANAGKEERVPYKAIYRFYVAAS
jgi:Protein of unknown function (DUF3455)